MDVLTEIQQMVRGTVGKTFASEVKYSQLLKEDYLEIYYPRMAPSRIKWMQQVLRKDPRIVVTNGSACWMITVYKEIKLYHPTNPDRNRVEFSTPSLVRFIKPHGQITGRVVILGMRYPNSDKHATIDISHDPVVVADWDWWCLQSDFLQAIKTNSWETITEWLIRPEDHPDWWGYEQAQGRIKGR